MNQNTNRTIGQVHVRSQLFDAANTEVNTGERWVGQDPPKMVKVALGGDVLAVKGAMVAYQGQVAFTPPPSAASAR